MIKKKKEKKKGKLPVYPLLTVGASVSGTVEKFLMYHRLPVSLLLGGKKALP